MNRHIIAYFRQYLLDEHKRLLINKDKFPDDRAHPNGVRNWNAGNRAYYDHAIATVHSLMDSLPRYVSTHPFIMPKRSKGR